MPDYQHKRGDTFDYILTIPVSDGDEGYADGFFVGWTAAAQLRVHQGDALIADLECEWVNPSTTRELRLYKEGTEDWPIRQLALDVQFTRTSDDYVLSSATAVIQIVRDVTIVSP